MTLDEIRKFSDEELGKRLVKAIKFSNFSSGDGWVYSSPKFQFVLAKTLCADLNKIAEAEYYLIDQTSFTDYGRCLVGVTECHGIGLDCIARIATATARQRAEAVLLCLTDRGI